MRHPNNTAGCLVCDLQVAIGDNTGIVTCFGVKKGDTNVWSSYLPSLHVTAVLIVLVW